MSHIYDTLLRITYFCFFYACYIFLKQYYILRILIHYLHILNPCHIFVIHYYVLHIFNMNHVFQYFYTYLKANVFVLKTRNVIELSKKGTPSSLPTHLKLQLTVTPTLTTTYIYHQPWWGFTVNPNPGSWAGGGYDFWNFEQVFLCNVLSNEKFFN